MRPEAGQSNDSFTGIMYVATLQWAPSHTHAEEYPSETIRVRVCTCVLPVGEHTGADDLACAGPMMNTLTCPSPIRACVEPDCSSLLENSWDGSGRRVVGGTGVPLWQEAAAAAGSSSALPSAPLLSGQAGWINHLQRCQHLPKQFEIGINGRWGCCSLCLISSTKCGFISYKMKPSVARRCKDQVREDGGRGGRDGRDVPVWRVGTFPFFFFLLWEYGGKERNGTRQNGGSVLGGGDTYPLKRGKM